MQVIWSGNKIIGFSLNLWSCGKLITSYAMIMAVALTGTPLLATSLYVCLNLMALVTFAVIVGVTITIIHNSGAYVSISRLQKFLLLDELEQESGLDVAGLRPKPEKCNVTVSNITAKWDKEAEINTLENISVEVKPGKLLAVIGPVGAGKSSLLMSLLGELPLIEGNITIQGKVSYIAQQPWVFSASLRQNIIFGHKFERERYNKILKACALNKDIELMPNGDGTLIGDRGVSLSGGQKARVSLARALYMDADIYILDDPLSAVDTAVGRHLFDKVVQGLLKNKPRILVTHQLHFLKEADEILILKDGKCLGQGTFEEMSTSGVDFSSLLKRNEEEESQAVVKVEREGIELARQLSHHRERHDSDVRGIGSQFSLASIGTEFEPETVQLPEEEERKEGTVGLRVYYEYFKAGAGVFKFIILVLLNLTAQAAYVGSDWWLSYWSNQEENRFAALQQDSKLRSEGFNITNITIPEVETHRNVYIFSGIIGGVFLFGLLRALMFFKVAVDASMHLHNTMFNRLLRAPVRFFDTNPVGRVLNRFSKDTGSMDDLLPITFFDFIQCLLLIVGIILVVGVVNPWVFIPLLPICILFAITRQYYITTSRHIKRLEGTTRSPVFSHLSASLQGLHTIRAFRVQEKFTTEFDSHQDLHTEAWFLFLSASRWLAVRLDWMCALFVTAVAFCCVMAASSLNAGLVGLSMTYAMTLMGMFQWAVRQSAEVENQMISVERVLEYSNLDTEASLTSAKPPPPEWPQSGSISAKGAKIRYSEGAPWVFKGLDFDIYGREKIGIVGRTGAGKSSLIAMLFRMVEPEGRISIDDINIQQIGLHELRNQISIIPQDPVLFTGTLRKNLDPFSEQDDAHLWNSLEEVQLKSAVDDLPGKLDTEVSEGGTNFSVGQRQLICLARAILRKTRILMIDEATANVDPRTDALIQQTIREKFSICTVLTIAHRLNTIMDSDRVMVLDEGQIVELDHPYNLLQDKKGFFYKMVQQTGKTEFEHLIEIARNTFTSSKSAAVDKITDSSKINGEIRHPKDADMSHRTEADAMYLSDVGLEINDSDDKEDTIEELIEKMEKTEENEESDSEETSRLVEQSSTPEDDESEKSKPIPDNVADTSRATKDDDDDKDDHTDEESHLLEKKDDTN